MAQVAPETTNPNDTADNAATTQTETNPASSSQQLNNSATSSQQLNDPDAVPKAHTADIPTWLRAPSFSPRAIDGDRDSLADSDRTSATPASEPRPVRVDPPRPDNTGATSIKELVTLWDNQLRGKEFCSWMVSQAIADQ